MADYSINAKITADTSGFDKGVKNAQKGAKTLGKNLDGMKKGFSGFSSGLKGIGKSLTSLFSPGGVAIAGIALAVKGLQKFGQAISETTKLYKEQSIAEQQLRQAVNNNPYVTGETTTALLNYASALQKTSNYGDEELIPFMTKLISSGRTEAETMKIMQAAVDMSATGMMSLDTAVTQLNATMNGNIGRLGQQNAELKSLTQEELESGKAVDILAEKFKGQAEVSIDSSKQLKNAWGDLKETLGKTFENALSPMRKFFAELIQGWADARKAKQAYDEAQTAVEKGTATAADLQTIVDRNTSEIEDYKKAIKSLMEKYKVTEDEIKKNWQYYAARLSKDDNKMRSGRYVSSVTPEEMRALELKTAELNAQLNNKKRQEEADNKARVQAEEIANAEKEKTDLNKKYSDIIAEQEKKWDNIKSVTGEAVGLEEKRNFYQDQLVSMLTESNGEMGKGTSLYDEQLNKLKEINSTLASQELSEKRKKEIEAETKAIEELDKALFEKRLSLYDKDSLEYHELMLKKIEMAKEEELATALSEEEKLKIADKYFLEAIAENKRYREAQEKENSKEVSSTKEKYKKMLSAIKSFTKAALDVMKKLVTAAFSLFSKAINLNLDDMMNSVLELEDKILTFFMETLPKLPDKLASIFGSFSVLFDTLLGSAEIENFLIDIFDVITQKLPQLLRQATKFILKIAKALIASLAKWINSGGSKELIEAALDVIMDMLNFILDNLPTIIEMAIKFLSQLIAGIIARLPEIVVQILKALPEIIKSLLKGIWDLIKSIWDGVIGGFKKAWNWIKEKISGHENGTNATRKGLAVVGEAGPELVDFRGGEKVYNNTNTQKILSGAGKGGNVFNVTFENTVDTTAYQMMKQLKGYQRSLAFNGVI